MPVDPSASRPAAPGPAVDRDRQRFLDALAGAPAGVSAWTRLVLSQPRGASEGPRRVTVRPIALKGEAHWQFVHHHATRDVTENLLPEPALRQVASLLGGFFRHAHLDRADGRWELRAGRKGSHLSVGRAAPAAADPQGLASPGPGPLPHDHHKPRHLSLDRPFLAALGVTQADGRLVPAMARKWRQIDKFLEIVDHALDEAGLAAREGLRVVDFGAGRGYLTFALHDWLTQGRGLAVDVQGVELREDLVAEAEATIERLGLRGLRMCQGDVRQAEPQAMDVMIALHACDTATDHALHLGLRAGARVIVCSPCCHKQLRPQLLSPSPLRPVFRHGIHAEQQAEMLTDTLRALLLESRGYETRVFEFVALEHTRKNKMILAVRRDLPLATLAERERRAWEQVEELSRFFGVREQCLRTLLAAEAPRPVQPAGALT